MSFARRYGIPLVIFLVVAVLAVTFGPFLWFYAWCSFFYCDL